MAVVSSAVTGSTSTCRCLVSMCFATELQESQDGLTSTATGTTASTRSLSGTLLGGPTLVGGTTKTLVVAEIWTSTVR